MKVKKRSMFDYINGTGKEHKSLSKEQVSKDSYFVRGFKIYFRKLLKFVTLNLVYTIFTYPLFCAALVYLVGYSENIANFVATDAFMHSFPWLAIMITGSIELLQSNFAWVAYMLFGVCAIAFGPLTAGYFYYLRNSAREEHAWFSDVFTVAKKNWKQGLLFGIIDLLICYALVNYAVLQPGGAENAGEILGFARYLAYFLGILYFIMRFYIYTMLVTFDLKFKQLMKNAIIFLFVNPLWNLLTLIITALSLILTFLIHPIVSFLAYPALFLTMFNFAGIYNSYKYIDKYMVQPALADEESKNGKTDDEPPIFEDK